MAGNANEAIEAAAPEFRTNIKKLIAVRCGKSLRA
jgi:hypothetical protein